MLEVQAHHQRFQSHYQDLHHPNQYLNAGVAEQNMTGMAAGLALEGYKVITYSIANFNTIRPLEQIRNDICYHNLDVTIASVGGGFVYGSAGYSHHAVQDIAMLGSLPNMTLLLPADAKETAFCMDYIFDTTGPKYIRLGRNGEKSLHSEKSIISKINAVSVTKGATIAVVAVGTIASVALELQELLLKKNCIVNIYTCPVIDTDFKKGITKTLKNMEYIFTLEEHVVDFGFGSLVKNAFEGAKQKIYSFGVDNNRSANARFQLRARGTSERRQTSPDTEAGPAYRLVSFFHARCEACARSLHGERNNWRCLHKVGPQIYRHRDPTIVFRHSLQAHRRGLEAASSFL
jgi:transketolase